MLSDVCRNFVSEASPLDPGLPAYGAHVSELIRELVRDADDWIGDDPYGQVAALTQLAAEATQWLASEAEDPQDPARRDGRQRAVADLMSFCRALAGS
jgi:hypothetical protein